MTPATRTAWGGLACLGALIGCGPAPASDDQDPGRDATAAPDAVEIDDEADAAPPGPFPSGGEPVIYAHSAHQLHKIDPDTLAVTSIGPFAWPDAIGPDGMTDIAVDKDGGII